MTMRRDVAFTEYGGVTLRGWLYLPQDVSDAAGAPGIIMAHGFSATKEMALDAYAERFCAAGFAVLVYDHRCLGASGGEPRQVINPWAQTRDYRAAIDWLSARPEVDASRIGLWGSSFSGGEVLVLGAIEHRVRAVVASVPFASIGAGYDDPADVERRFHALRTNLEEMKGAGLADLPAPLVGPLAVVHDTDVPADASVFLAQPEAAEWFTGMGRRPGSTWRNEVWLHNAFGTSPAFDPGVAVGFLRAPTLFVIATDDNVAPTALALDAFERASGPKEIELVPGGHFTGYSGAALEHCAAVEAAFFARHL